MVKDIDVGIHQTEVGGEFGVGGIQHVCQQCHSVSVSVLRHFITLIGKFHRLSLRHLLFVCRQIVYIGSVNALVLFLLGQFGLLPALLQSASGFAHFLVAFEQRRKIIAYSNPCKPEIDILVYHGNLIGNGTVEMFLCHQCHLGQQF